MKQYMDTTKPKKEYVTPQCEVVMLGLQDNLLDDAPGSMYVVIMCGSKPCSE